MSELPIPISVTIDLEDAEALLPLVEAQMHDTVGSVEGALWRVLHTALTSAVQARND